TRSRAPPALPSFPYTTLFRSDTPVIPSLSAAFVYSGGGPEELMKIHYDAAVVDRYIDLAPGYGWGYRVGFREAPYNYFTTYRNLDRKSTRLNSSHVAISYAVF